MRSATNFNDPSSNKTILRHRTPQDKHIDNTRHSRTVLGVSYKNVTKLGMSALILLTVSCATDTGLTTEYTNPVITEALIEEEIPAPDCTLDDEGRFVVCGDENIAIEHSQRGAAYRYRTNSTLPGDAILYLTDATKYEARLEQILGKAELVPGGNMYIYGLYSAAFAFVTPSITYQHEWALANGDYLVEQIMFLKSSEEATMALKEWQNASVQAGMDSPKGFETPENSHTIVYRASVSTDPNRQCITQTLAIHKNILVSANYLTGGDCSNLPINAPSIVLLYTLQDIKLITN